MARLIVETLFADTSEEEDEEDAVVASRMRNSFIDESAPEDEGDEEEEEEEEEAEVKEFDTDTNEFDVPATPPSPPQCRSLFGGDASPSPPVATTPPGSPEPRWATPPGSLHTPPPVRKRKARLVFVSSEEDVAPTQELPPNEEDIPTQPYPPPSPLEPVVGGGGESFVPVQHEAGGRFLSPYLWGQTVNGQPDGGFNTSPAPTLSLNVHIPDVRRLDELLFLVRLDPMLRLTLERFRAELNGVAVVVNKYRQHSNGGRFYGIGSSMQFVPRWVRNYLFGDNCIYLDCTSTWAYALDNLKRVMEDETDTPTLSRYVQNPTEFREAVQSGLKYKYSTPSQNYSKVKLIILWAVHGFPDIAKHLEGDALLLVERLASDVDLLARSLLHKPQLYHLLPNYKSTEQTLTQLEAVCAQNEPGEEEDEDAPTPNSSGKKKKKKKKKGKTTNMFMLNREKLLVCDNEMGRGVSALYTLVESETTYALAEFLKEEEFDVQIMIFDGIVARPHHDILRAVRDLDDLCERGREYVLKKFGWDMPIKAEDMEITHKQQSLLNGPKVFYDLPPVAQLIRQVIYELGERRGLKRFGNALLEEDKRYPGLYQILRYEVKGSTGSIIGTSQDPMPLIHNLLDSSPYAVYASSAHEKKLQDWFMENQDMRFEKFYMRGTNMWRVRFEDGICDFHTNDNVPIFHDWNFYKTTGTTIPVHFLSYPQTNYVKTLAHIRAYEAGDRPDSPTPLFDKFIEYQLCKEDIKCLRILLGRLQMPLKDGWNIAMFITGPEQVGKSVILNEIKSKIPLSGQLVKVLTGKSSDKFPLGDVSSKHLIVTDEAESLITKLGYDLLKSLVSNGAFDADVKYKSDTSKPDGAGLLLVGVGNSLLDQATHIDKAFVERVALFKFEKLVNDKDRDTTLSLKLAGERGQMHVWNALSFLNCMKTPGKAHKFWQNVASPNLRLNRELAKLEGDLTAQLLNNHSEFYRVDPDPQAPPLFVEDLQKAVMQYASAERKQDLKKFPKNWLESVKRLPYFSVQKVDVCGRCHAFNPNQLTCRGHYNKMYISKRDVVFGMRLEHFPLGVQFAGPAVSDMPPPDAPGAADAEEKQQADDDEAAYVPSTPMDPSLFSVCGSELEAARRGRPNGAKTGEPTELSQHVLNFLNTAEIENGAKFTMLANISKMPLPPGEKIVVRTYRRKQAKALYPALEGFNGVEIDKILMMARKHLDRPAEWRVYQPFNQASRPVETGDSWHPRF